MNDWVAVCRVDDIPVLGSRRVSRDQGPAVALFRNQDSAVFALLDRCPHKGGPLSQGIVSAHGVTCPLHNWTIAFANGQALTPDEGHTPTFNVKVDSQGHVYLSAAQLATDGIDLPLPVAGPCTRACQHDA